VVGKPAWLSAFSFTPSAFHVQQNLLFKKFFFKNFTDLPHSRVDAAFMDFFGEVAAF
jgi:hypothetical protein